ncbi:MAG: hypothetical protein ABFE07_16985 [Armatimonadia bacterium]
MSEHMTIEEAQERAWLHELARLQEWGIAEISPSWRQAYLDSTIGRAETLSELLGSVVAEIEGQMNPVAAWLWKKYKRAKS